MTRHPYRTPYDAADGATETAIGLSRRTLLRRGAAGGLVLGLGGFLAACGSDSSSPAPASTTTAAAAAGGFKPSAGTDIPAVKVRFDMWPYGDAQLAVVGMSQGWFDDVGISLPNGKRTRLEKQTFQELLNDQIDVAPGYVPLTLQTYPKAKNLKVFHLQDSYVGNYAMANPRTGAKTYEDFAGAGQDFATAFKSTIGQMKGKRIALSDSGSNREFFNTLLRLGGLKPSDLKISVISDARIVQLARAGSIDYALPGGAAQSVEVLNLGFYRTAGIKQIVEGLPKGDPAAVNGIGHAGLQASEEYIDGNLETVLRMMSVFYRIIDQIEKQPDVAVKALLPALSSSAGVDISITDAKRMFADFYGILNFEACAKILLDKDDNLYYETVYGSQIKAAKAGGVLPKSLDVTPDDLIVHKRLYLILRDLKAQYETLLKRGVPKGDLATRAAEQYANRNYLDAVRLLTAAA